MIYEPNMTVSSIIYNFQAQEAILRSVELVTLTPSKTVLTNFLT